METCYFQNIAGGVIAIADLIHLDDHKYMVTRINVPVSWRGQGLGRRLLQHILADADRTGTTLYLGPAPSGGLDYDQLAAWYQRHGFEWNGPYSMVRYPK